MFNFKLNPDTEFALSETLRVLNRLDPENATRIEELLMSCESEQELIEKLIDPFTFCLYFEPGTEPKGVKLGDIVKEEGIILTEYFHLPHKHMNKEGVGVLSEKKLTAMPLYVRANQQIAVKEGKAAIESNTRNIAGQVTGKTAKAGSLTDSEIYTLIGNGSDNIIREMLGPASHDMVAKREMKQSIIKTGDVSLNDLTDNKQNKRSLRYMSAVMKAYDLDNDLVDQIIKY